MKLNVFGSIPGYHLYWCNDEDAAIEQLLAEGFEFVQPAEVKMESALVVDKDLDNRLSKYVGTRADGSPLRAYLLKATEELWQDFQDGNQAQADDWDEAIRQGEIEADRNRYKPTGYDIKLTTGRR